MRLATLLGPDLKQVLKEDPDQVRELLADIHPEDVADLVSELDADEAAELLSRMPAEDAAPIFERLEEYEQEELVELMPPESVAQIASEMEPDDRADLFSVLPPAVGDPIREKLEKVDPEAVEEIREIEKWPETSAGHLMTTKFVHVTPDMVVSDALDAVRAFSKESDASIYNVYAMSKEEKLLGIASLRELVVSQPYQRVEEVMRTNFISVPPDLDQEEVARRMAKYDLNAMPVVDAHGALLGLCTIDDIVDVLTEEQAEDVQKLGAVEPLEVPYFQTSILSFVKKRGTWLVVLFFGEFFTQTALRHYDPVFEAIKGASYYVPLLISAGGNSGSQSSTLIIRGLAVGEIRPGDWWKVFFRELAQGLVLGLGLGVIGFTRVALGPEHSIQFGVTVGLTLVGIVIGGCTVGSMLPIVLRRIGVDPATSSTPFIASLVDVLGIVIFVHVAKIIMASVIAASAAPALH
jgi:magnesium transporter